MSTARWFWEKMEITRGCNASFVTIIPKVSDPIGLGDFRPISLIGCYYKIIAKILAERVKKVVGKVVGKVQNAFIKGRFILDGILVANETIEFLKSKREKGFIFKVDFEKAYDSINWEFLLNIMKRMGFGIKWCKWVENCLKSSSMSVLVNGSPTEEFKLERGIRQGDPLSPFLFILAAEGLNAIVNEAVEKGIFRGVRVGRNRVVISHLQYADDTIFLVNGVKIMLGVNDSEIDEMARWIRCSRWELPFIYLGLPIDMRNEERVADKGRWVNNKWQWEWDWGRSLSGRVCKEFDNLLGVLQNVFISNDGRDRRRWMLQENGEFTVKALTRLVEEKVLRVKNGNQETLWNNWPPKKVNIFVWRALKRILPVLEELDKIGIDLNTLLCPCCDSVVETCAHSLVTYGCYCPKHKQYDYRVNSPSEESHWFEFHNWYRNLRIVLTYEKKIKFVEQPIGPAPDPETVDPDTIDKYYETVNLEEEVACLMLLSMSSDLQRTLEKYNAYDMMKELKTMFEEQATQELFKIVKAFYACKQEEGQSVSSYLLKMKSYLDTLERLGYATPNELGTIAELHAMLKLHEKCIPKKAETPVVLAIREGKIQKDKRKPRGVKGKDKGKNKLAYAPKPKIPSPPKRDNPTKDSICHHCKEVGHWRRNCSSYQAELKNRKEASMASTSGIFTIELYSFPNKAWVYDTGCGTYICNTLQGLRKSKKLKHGALSLYMGNEMRAAVEAIGSFDLILPSGLLIVLENCHFAPTVTMGVSISRLVENGYIHTFTNYGISVSKDNVFYFNAIPHDGIYEIDMHNLYPNVSSTFNVSNKRVKYSLDSSYLWYCRVGHNNARKPANGQSFNVMGSSNPTHNESLEKCKSCIIGKMARKPFPHQVERAKSLSGLIHTDVYGPFRTMSLKRVFQNDVENQLGYGIQLTPPYTPQYNEVFERKTQTLLDMVRSMMNLTALPKSFWGYALESAARILNMVQTKKVTQGNNPHSTRSDEEHNKVVPMEVELQNVKVPIRRSARIPQAPDRSWNKRFDVEIKMIGFTQNPDEPCVYLKASRSSVAFLIHLGEATYILGIKIIRDRSKRLIALSQSAYFDKILKKFKMENSKRGSVPIQENPDYKNSQCAQTPSEVKRIQKVPYT
ncbi:zinc finger, CCHC-type containing protein [Tanacetum coccineum]|uniref:Zinc finger, CCHC-type containing protein n=1 Tax=Tanacetum coccineum TaxID=301880 RepID=A0ABQ5EAM8_9ASTR